MQLDSLDILNKSVGGKTENVAEDTVKIVDTEQQSDPQPTRQEINIDMGNGGRIEGAMIDGQLDGICKIFKNRLCIAEISYTEGVKNGTCRFFQDDALFAEIEYKDDKKNGEARYYNEAGAVQKTETFVNDLKHGPSCTYYDDGSIFEKCEYENDKLKGKAMRFDLKGKKME